MRCRDRACAIRRVLITFLLQETEDGVVGGMVWGTSFPRLMFRLLPGWPRLALHLSRMSAGWRSLASRHSGGSQHHVYKDTARHLLASPVPYCGTVYLTSHPEIQGRGERRELQAGAEKFLEGQFGASILAGIQEGPGRHPLGHCPEVCWGMGWMTSPVPFLLRCSDSGDFRMDPVVMALVPPGLPMAS